MESGYVPAETPSNNAFGEGSKNDETKEVKVDDDSDLSDLDF